MKIKLKETIVRSLLTSYVSAAIVTLAVSCGSGNDNNTSSSSKNLFSSWAEDGTSFVLDMSHGSFGTFSFTYLITGGAYCDCMLTVGGTQSSGNAVMFSCTYRTGSGGGSDPGCSTLNNSYTYSKTDTVLTVCVSGGGCETYH